MRGRKPARAKHKARKTARKVVNQKSDKKHVISATTITKLLGPPPFKISQIEDRIALILDPMLATGGTLIATIDMLKEAGCRKIRGIFLVAAPEGLKKVQKRHPDVDIYVAAVDERLNDIGYILPGLGDAGDKIFGTK